ncbi:MAG: hypothetical protein O3A51_04370 [Verrucomicrobia bacterium]|nr:hypothetical protein [Verrucomicrobiota bacterium]
MEAWLYQLEVATRRPWMGLYMQILAGALVLGAVIRVANFLGWTGRAWKHSAAIWRFMDCVVLIFNSCMAYALWTHQRWSLAAFVGGAIGLQIVPYLLFRKQLIDQPEDEAMLKGLIGTTVVLLGVLFVLLHLGR